MGGDSDTFADLDLDLGQQGDETATVGPEGPRFRIDDELARGGLGRVHKGFDLQLQREVAIKQLLHDAPSTRARFDREARLTARLQHPNIVPIYDAGSDAEGLPYLAMRLVHGRSLQAVIDETPSLDARLALLPHVIAACNAVAYAHSQRICHRDLKPENILVGAYGETVVIDWGLAKDLTLEEDLVPSGEPVISGVSGTSLTRIGTVMGTPAYMPPEQAAGRPVAEAADVYALGAVLYHLLTGKRPYQGSADTLAAVTTEPPPPMRDLVQGIPADLTAIVDKAMQRRVEQRYPSAAELAHDLERFEAGRWVEAYAYSPLERVGRWVRQHKGATTLGVLLALTLTGALVGLTQANRIATDRAEALATLQEEQRLQLDERTLEQAELLATRDPTRALQLLDGLSTAHPFDGRVHAVASTIRTTRPPRSLENPQGAPIEWVVGSERGVLAAGGDQVQVYDTELDLVQTITASTDIVRVRATPNALLYCTADQLFDALDERPALALDAPCWNLFNDARGVFVQTERTLFQLRPEGLVALGSLSSGRYQWVVQGRLLTYDGASIVARRLEQGLPTLARAPVQQGVLYGRVTEGGPLVLLGSQPSAQIVRVERGQVVTEPLEMPAEWLVTGAWVEEDTLVLGGDSEHVHLIEVSTGRQQTFPVRGRPYDIRADDGRASVVTDAGGLFLIEPVGPHWTTREIGGSDQPLSHSTLGPDGWIVASGRNRLVAQPRDSDEGRVVAWLGTKAGLYRTAQGTYGVGSNGTFLLEPEATQVDERPSLAAMHCGGELWVLGPDAVWNESGRSLPLPARGRGMVCAHDERFAVVWTEDEQARVLDPRTGAWHGVHPIPGSNAKDNRNLLSAPEGVVLLGKQAWKFVGLDQAPVIVGDPLHGASAVSSWQGETVLGERAGDLSTASGQAIGSMNALPTALVEVDGQLLAGDYFGGMVRWKQRGQPPERISGHTQYIHRLDTHPAGRWVASTGWDGRVWIWDSTTTPLVGRMLPEQTDAPLRIAWSTDGRTLYTVDQRGVVRTWPHDVPAEPEALRAWVRERRAR